MQEFHTPVLFKETLDLLDPRPGGTYLDATLGGAGHSVEILKRIGPEGTLVGIDRDAEAIEYARKRLSGYPGRVILVHANFRQLRSVLESEGIREIDGALFDLGVSSHQLDTERGFSFLRNEQLDMRMDADENVPTAADVVNRYSEADLAHLFWKYGEERYSRRIARAVVQARQKTPIRTTGELAAIITAAVPRGRKPGEIHPATRVFQSIRIEVNAELQAAEEGIIAAVDALNVGGRIVVISFHGGEHRVVKDVFRKLSGRCECPPRFPECRCGARKVLEILTRKAIAPGPREIEENPRSRSARVRCALKVG